MGILGTTVFHASLGEGRVVNTTENQYGNYITVQFDNGKEAVFALSDIPELFSSDSVEFKRLQQEQFEKREKEQRKLKEKKEREEKEALERYKLMEEEKLRFEQERIARIEQEKVEELRRGREKIKNIVNLKNIKELLHFTSVDNLGSILKNGILSRDEMEKQMIKASVNDEKRFDFCLNGISCSITLPNAPLLYKFKSSNLDRNYVILKIKPDVLWEKECLFCKENAASGKVAWNHFRRAVEAFEQMFGDYDKMHTRADLEKLYADGFIKQNMPTHNQAEVLVMGKIEPEYITGMYFFKDDVSIPFRDKLLEIFKEEPEDDFSFECVPDDFMRRCKKPEKDFWKNTKSVQMEVHQDTTSSLDDEIPF